MLVSCCEGSSFSEPVFKSSLTLDEAVALAARVGCGATVAHHHGLFAFNTRPFADIERKATEPDLPVRLIPARLDLELRLQLA